MPDRPSPPVCDLEVSDLAGGARRVRLKWHMLRRVEGEAPFKPETLVLGWRAGASLEIDVRFTADDRAVVMHDATLGPSTTGHGVVAELRAAALDGHFFNDADGRPDPAAPCLSLAAFMGPLRDIRPGEGALLQLDLKMPAKGDVSAAAIRDVVEAVRPHADRVVAASKRPDIAHAIAAALPGTAVGYDPLDRLNPPRSGLEDPNALLRHLLRESSGIRWVYLHHPLVAAALEGGVPLVVELQAVGLLVDVWTIDAGREGAADALRAAIRSGADQVTTNGAAALAALARELGLARA